MKKTPSKKRTIDPELQEFLRKDAAAAKVKRWQVLGVAGMDTASLLISDPCYSLPYTADHKESDLEIRSRKEVYDTCGKKGEEAHYGQVNYRKGHPGAGVIVHSGSDGEVTVYGLLDGLDRVCSVFFSFDGELPPGYKPA